MYHLYVRDCCEFVYLFSVTAEEWPSYEKFPFLYSLGW